ncbi:efflux RND transporter periplasmic adaptor subunit [Caballeronia sordidicola]|uniref:Putative RND efflux membrane fusion protein n=1 Tax=Caballeronia sordidicola TaxID=196367 RepID=A0A242M3P5_CABSO|nr:HlyD family efflux transporter periplasmic adaptor subunit [Caballeronia sordidicola]OTP65715.1 putative RND efflux membrane fusion protein [Caballeronia sordidicola]
MSSNTRRLIVCLTLVLVLIAAPIVTVKHSLGFAETPKPDSQWVRITSQPLEIHLGLAGHIAPETQVTVTSPFDGSVERVQVVEGQRVEQGQTLLVLETTQIDVLIRQALADVLKARRAVKDLEQWEGSQDMGRARRAVATARLSLNDTQQKLRETRTLLARGIVARTEVDSLEQQAKLQQLDFISAQAELAAALSRGRGENVQLADMELANATARYDALVTARGQRNITASFAGVTTRAPVTGSAQRSEPLQAGEKVSQGESLLGLSSVEHVKAIAKVNEVDIDQLRDAQAVEITGDGFEGVTLQGSIESVGVQGLIGDSQDGANYEVVVSIPALKSDQQARVRLGMSARLSIVVYRNDHAIVVPVTAVSTVNGKSYLTYRKTPDQVATQLPITIGHATAAGIEVLGAREGFIRVKPETTPN